MNPLRNPDVESKLLPDGHVVLFVQGYEWAQTISPLAGIAWEFCDGSHSIEEIIDQVKEIAGLDTTTSFEPEITKLVNELFESGFLIEHEPQAHGVPVC